jgi:hypothetical protein
LKNNKIDLDDKEKIDELMFQMDDKKNDIYSETKDFTKLLFQESLIKILKK